MNNTLANKVFKGTVIIILIGILAKLASFISEAVLAGYLGTTYRSDAYYMVSSIKDVIYPMLSVGIWKVFLPVYKEKISLKKLQEADRVADKTITFFTLVSFVAVLIIVCFANTVVSIVAPGFSGETRALCIRLVRISSPMYVLIIASAVYATMLQCHDKFLGSQIREVATHIPTIIAAVFFYKRFGIDAMAYALVIGGVVRLLVEFPFVDWGYKYKPDFHFRGTEFITMLKRLPSALVSEGVTQINTLIDKAMGSTLATGTISGLNYAHKLMNVFSGLLSTAITTALYPQMIELIALKEKQKLKHLMELIINVFSMIMIPVTIACILCRTEIVSLAFERGSFNADSVALTAGVFAAYIISVFFSACNTVINNLFYGYGNTVIPMKISIVNLLINVILNIVLIKFLGVNGLALATSLSAIFSFFIRMKMAGTIINLEKKKLFFNFLKVLFSASAACIVSRAISDCLSVNSLISLLLFLVVGLPAYVLLIVVFKVDSVDEAVRWVRNIIRR